MVVEEANRKRNNAMTRSCHFCNEGCFSSSDELKEHIKSSHSGLRTIDSKHRFRDRAKKRRNTELIYKINSAYIPHSYTDYISFTIEKMYTEQKISGIYKQKIEGAIGDLESRLRNTIENCSIQKYGSVFSGFGQIGSDVDLNLNLTDPRFPFFNSDLARYSELCDIFGEKEAKNLTELALYNKICHVLKSLGAFHINFIHSKRVKVISFYYYYYEIFEFDLSINNRLPVENTDLLRCYTEIDSRVSKLGLIIKHWASKRRIKDTLSNTLNSYTYCILLIYFLQQLETPVLPVLQRKELPPNYIGDLNCVFDKEIQRYKEISTNDQSLGYLLYSFFTFYAHFNWEGSIVDIRYSGLITRTESRCRLHIQDPFEIDRNLGQYCRMDENADAVINEFHRAAYLIKSGKFGEVFKELLV